MLKQALAPIHPDGWRFIAIFAVVSALLFWLAQPLGWLGAHRDLVVRLFLPRSVAGDAGARRAGGGAGRRPRSSSVGRAPPPRELEMGEAPMLAIGIFLNVLRRACEPHADERPRRAAHLSRRANSSTPASTRRARITSAWRSGSAPAAAATSRVVQIAGLVARRIVCDVERRAGCRRRPALRPHPLRQPHRRLSAAATGRALAVVGQRAVGGETVFGRRARRGSRRARGGALTWT